MENGVSNDNARELARAVLIHGPISRGQLGLRLGLSAASLTRLSKPFLDRGIFVEVDEGKHGIGRPTRPLDVRVDARQFVGVEITKDAVFGVATDLRTTELASARRSLVTGSHVDHSVDRVVAVIADIVAELGGAEAFAAIGASVGGKVSGERVVTRAPFLDWRDIDLAWALEQELGIPAIVENDVVALATAEQWVGQARGVPNFAVITIGTGVGYGLVINDRVIITPDTGLGLGGHFPLNDTGPICDEGHRGCASAMLSMRSISAQVSSGLGRVVDYEGVLRLAEEGDPTAERVIVAAGRALGRFIAAAANLVMLDTVVLAGEGIDLWHLTADLVRAESCAGRDPDARQLRILWHGTEPTTWARGAAAVAIGRMLGTLVAAPPPFAAPVVAHQLA